MGVFKENNERNWNDYKVEESNQDDSKDFVQVSEKPVILNEAEWVDYDENNKYFKDENKIVLSRGDEALDNNGIDVKTIPDKKAENQQGPFGNNFDEGFKAKVEPVNNKDEENEVDPINNKDDEDVVDPEFSVEDEKPVQDNEVVPEFSVPVSGETVSDNSENAPSEQSDVKTEEEVTKKPKKTWHKKTGNKHTS